MSTVDRLAVRAYTVPTDAPESDGTLEWDRTTMVLVQLFCGDVVGTGYSYTDASAALLIDRNLRSMVEGADALAPTALWHQLIARVRNLGVPGIAACAISAIDSAAWNLKARLLDQPLVTLLGQVRESIPVYGSGGFTSYSRERLQQQFRDWESLGITRMKMKIGRDPAHDVERMRDARAAIDSSTQLFIDANGAFTATQALAFAELAGDFDVRWFEEPVVSDDLEGLRWLRARVPAGMAIAAGEYGYEPRYFRRMLAADAVDVLQADATRCLGITGFLQADALCQAFGRPLSAHTAPTLHAHVCCAAASVVHVEYFHDHARIESQFFDGAAHVTAGALVPDLNCTGMGFTFNEDVATPFLVYPGCP